MMVSIARLSHSCSQIAHIAKTEASKITSNVLQAFSYSESVVSSTLDLWADRIHASGKEMLHEMLLHVLLPSLYKYSKEEVLDLQESATAKLAEISSDKVTARTVSLDYSDEAKLDGFEIASKNAKSRKVLLFLLGNNELWQESVEQFHWFHEQTGWDIVAFNYRGVGLSTGFPKRGQDLIDDASEQIRFLVGQGVQPKNLALFGRSLGGAFAILSAAEVADDFKVHVINDRSFRTIMAMVALTVRIFKDFFVAQVQSLSWGLDPESAISKLEGALIVIHNVRDLMIPYPASFKAAVDETAHKIKKLFFIAMDDSKFHEENPELKEDEWDPHFRPFTVAETKAFIAALKSISSPSKSR